MEWCVGWICVYKTWKHVRPTIKCIWNTYDHKNNDVMWGAMCLQTLPAGPTWRASIAYIEEAGATFDWIWHFKNVFAAGLSKIDKDDANDTDDTGAHPITNFIYTKKRLFLSFLNPCGTAMYGNIYTDIFGMCPYTMSVVCHSVGSGTTHSVAIYVCVCVCVKRHVHKPFINIVQRGEAFMKNRRNKKKISIRYSLYMFLMGGYSLSILHATAIAIRVVGWPACVCLWWVAVTMVFPCETRWRQRTTIQHKRKTKRPGR